MAGIVHGGTVRPGQRFKFKSSRGIGSFTVTRVGHTRVTLRDDWNSREKTISLKTLRSDCERMENYS